MNKSIKKHNKMLMETGETKLHNKLVKSKKGWLKVALGTTFASAALFTFSAVNVVNADTITPQVQSNSQPEQQSTTEVAQTNNIQSNQATIQSQAAQQQSSNQQNLQTNQQSTQGQNQATQPQSAQRAAMTKLASNQDAGNQAVIQYGVLNQDVKGQSGTVYKAGTQVSRGVLGLNNQPSGDYYLSMSMQQLVGEAHFGPAISPAYVTPTNTQSYPDIGNQGQWGSQSYFNQADSGSAVTPVNGQGVQADKSKLQADITKAKQLLAGKVKFSPNATTTGVNPATYLQSHLTKAEAVNDNSSATQSTVDSAYNDLDFALSQIEADGNTPSQPTQTVDKSALKSDVAAAQAKIDAGGYTDASISALKQQIANANGVLNNPNATQSDVDTAKQAIDQAVAGLVKADTPNNPSDNGGHDNNGGQTPNDNNGGQTPSDNGSGDKDGATTSTDNGGNSNHSGTSENGNAGSDNGSNTNSENSNSKQSNKSNDSESQTEGKHFAPTTNTDNDYKGRHAASTVVVENGQTLSQIAADNGVSMDSLLQNNPDIKDANHVANGQIVNLHASQHKDNATSIIENKNTLPQTGQNQNETLTFSGILAVFASLVLGLGEFFKIRKED